ncbi:MAG: 3-isopropylmalate dehydratase small subunit [Chloroflexi bacterium]|nr:3-isopropylmalate dehydratase small subunit [Chloroflexota bacterium]
MKPVNLIVSKAVLLPIHNIDTDQIIPARFLKVTDKIGLGANLFADWRYLENGIPNPDFVLNQPENQGAEILIAGDNFGCGSSREHAPWALVGFGFKAIVSTSFADIFKNNALKNGLIPVQISGKQYQHLENKIHDFPETILRVCLDELTLEISGDETFSFPMDPFSRTCLLNGVDELGYLLELREKITSFELKRSYP